MREIKSEIYEDALVYYVRIKIDFNLDLELELVVV
jgi:hypothetical protein